MLIDLNAVIEDYADNPIETVSRENHNYKHG